MSKLATSIANLLMRAHPPSDHLHCVYLSVYHVRGDTMSHTLCYSFQINIVYVSPHTWYTDKYTQCIWSEGGVSPPISKLAMLVANLLMKSHLHHECS